MLSIHDLIQNFQDCVNKIQNTITNHFSMLFSFKGLPNEPQMAFQKFSPLIKAILEVKWHETTNHFGRASFYPSGSVKNLSFQRSGGEWKKIQF